MARTFGNGYRETEVSAFEIRTLTPCDVRERIQDILGIAADVEGEYWKEEHFLRELPDKWKLSFAVWSDERPIAYAILSRKGPAHVHLHHFMVNLRSRGKGLGRRMLALVFQRVREAGCQQLTLKVNATDQIARRFYERYGFRKGVNAGAYCTLVKFV